MTAHELARLLLAGPDLPVHKSYPCGDYWNTVAAPEIKTCPALGLVIYSSYHRLDKVADEDGNDKDPREAILL